MPQRDYAFGFHDDIAPLYSTGKGLTEAVVREISAIKKEPQWMLDYRLRSLELFNKLPMPDFGPDLSGIRFEEMCIRDRPFSSLFKGKNRANRDIYDKIRV